MSGEANDPSNDSPRAGGDRRVLAFVSAAAFAVVLSSTMVPVAVPAIGGSLSLDRVALGWIVTGYFLVNGVAIPFFGRLADIYGVSRLYGVGLATFFLGSVLCALAPNFSVLIAGRIVQGTGAAAVMGLGATAVSLVYAPERRGRAIGLVGAAVGAGAASGPVLGGGVTDLIGWRVLFVVGALVGLLAPFAFRMLPRAGVSADRRFDLAGGLLLAFGLGGCLLALTEGAERDWGGPLVVASALVGVLALGGFVLRQATAAAPFVPRALLRSRAYVRLCGATLLLVGAIITVEVSVPQPLADLGGFGAARIGVILLPAALLTVVWGPGAGRIVDRFGAGLPLAAGTIVSAGAILLLSGSDFGGSAWMVSLLVTAVGLGATLARIATVTGVSLIVPEENLPSGLAVNEMVWISGTSIGTAIFSAVVTARSNSTESLNPFHTGAGVGYSDAYLALAVPLVLALLVALVGGRGSGVGSRKS